VSETLLKKHGNWRSDAVRVYIQPNMDTVLSVGDAMATNIYDNNVASAAEYDDQIFDDPVAHAAAMPQP
jgi:hypothetical protein